jgi:hypothetical protein
METSLLAHRLNQIAKFRNGLARRLFLWRVLFYIQLIMSAITSSVLVKGMPREHSVVVGVLSLVVTAVVGSVQPAQRERILLDLWRKSIELESRVVRGGEDATDAIDDDLCTVSRKVR